MSINDVYTILIDYQYEICRNIFIVFIVMFFVFVVLDVIKWRYYGRK